MAQNVAGTGVTTLLAVVWLLVRRCRERELREGDAGDAWRAFEVEVGPALENGRLAAQHWHGPHTAQRRLDHAASTGCSLGPYELAS
ncbi:hypothetical protein [Streptomyces sp. NBC_01236]|uniref:hypothetical protein n=1 Tax=Streptomyces sp. NBC_01236 TaxID=2903789 RepID=UPI002E0FE671|nr:hypothetical protein OG324_02050 [Streptomyces sp. NBC_01236]